MTFLKKLVPLLISAGSLVFAIGICEGVLRLKNKDMKNYDIEMWRYAKLLKQRSANPVLGHEHVPSSEAVLQSVPVRINSWGLRGGPVEVKRTADRRILVLGASIAMGWGVPEEKTLAGELQTHFQKDGLKVEVLNSGVGNYNAVRYTELFNTKLKALEPTDIVVQYFLRDAEKLEAGGGNWWLRESQLVATLSLVLQRLAPGKGATTLEGHYAKVYDPSSVGFSEMKSALTSLAKYAHEKGIRIVLAMTPDVQNLSAYPFNQIHSQMAALSQQLGMEYVDFLPALQGMKPNEIFAMKGDPHPNSEGHRRMAEVLYPVLKAPAPSQTAPRNVAGIRK